MIVQCFENASRYSRKVDVVFDKKLSKTQNITPQGIQEYDYQPLKPTGHFTSFIAF